MSNYSINIAWSDQDGGFIATIPEFKNLSAFGETYEEALNQAKAALDGYIEIYNQDRQPLPEPNKVSGYSGQIRLRIPKDLHYQLALQSLRQGVSLNTYMVFLLSVNHGFIKADIQRHSHALDIDFNTIAEAKDITINRPNRLMDPNLWKTGVEKS